VVRPNFLHDAVEVGGDLAILDPVLDIRPHPVLHVMVHCGTAMDKRHPRAVSP
jgi:hypothetical protein